MEDLDSFAAQSSTQTRIDLDRRAVEAAAKASVLDVDEQRTRTRYVDGQLLGAEGFRRDHAAFDRRQRDLARLVDRGVVFGLDVRQALVLDGDGLPTAVPDPTKLTIEPGHGVTGTGEVIILAERVAIDLTEFARFQQLDGTFALDRQPREPSRTLSGVFTLALRLIRFTANPVAPYPSKITGERRLEDGDVVDATLVTLVPIDAESSLDGVDAGPAVLARRVFAEGLEPLPANNALPIAVVALARGQIAWIDVDIARREATADPGHSFGAGHRNQLEALLRHFAARMAAILERRGRDGLGTRFAATDYFEVLPPCGVIPSAAVSAAGDRLVQWFFPVTVEAELALVPEDELPALLEESLLLGPLPLSQGAKTTEASPVLIIISVPRAYFLSSVSALGGVMRQPIGPRLGSFTYRRPVDAWLRQFRRPSLPTEGPTAPVLVPWESALNAATSLHFVRQRWRSRTPFALARYGPMPEEQRPSSTLSPLVISRIDAAGEIERFDRLLATADADALERLEALFSSQLFADPLFVNGVIAELSSRSRRRLLEPGTVTVGGSSVSIAGVPAGAPAPLRVRPLRVEEVAAIALRYGGHLSLPEDAATTLGGGMAALRALVSELSTFDNRIVIAQTLRLPELDRRARAVAGEAREELANRLLALSQANDVNGIRDVVGYIRAEPPPLDTPQRSDGTLSTGFEHAVAIGQSGLFTLLWNEGDDEVRAALDALFVSEVARQPLSSVAVMAHLCRLTWNVELPTPDDVRFFIESLYRWPFTPRTAFRVPTLSSSPDIRLSASNPRVKGILNFIPSFLNVLEDPGSLGFPVLEATKQLEAAGFPGAGVNPVDAYRILGCGLGFDAIRLTGAVHAFLLAEFPAFVAELSAAVTAADVKALKDILAVWNEKL